MGASLPTPLDVAASIDRVLRRNIQWPLRNLVFADSPVTVTDLDRSSMCDAVGGAMVVNLPDATLNKGMFFEIKKTDISVNTVTIQCTIGGQTIDGAGAKVLIATNDFIVVESDGANYKIVALVLTPPAGGGAVFYTVKKIVKTDGVATLVPVDGTLIPFTVAVDGECSFWAAGQWAGFSPGVAGGSLNFRIDGVDYAPLTWLWNNGAGGDFTLDESVTPHISLFLTAGPHTVELVASNVTLALQASAANPLTLSVLFPAASFSTAAPTPKAATFVVHTVPGLGDFTTIAAALAALVPLGGGYILAREGTFAENLVQPNVPVVLRGCGDNTILQITGGPAAAMTVGFDQTLTIEDMAIDGLGVAGNRAVDVTAILSGTNKVLLNRVSLLNMPTLYKSVVTSQAIVEFDNCRSTGVTLGWDSGGDGTLIVRDHLNTFGPVTGAVDSAVLIARNTKFGAIDVGIAKLVDCISTAVLTLYKLRSEVLGHLFDFAGRGVDIVAASSLNDFVACKFKSGGAETARVAGNFNTFSNCDTLVVLETGTADNNRYVGLSNAAPSTIIGPKTTVDNENTQSFAADVTLDETHRTVLVSAAAAARTVNLPAAANATYRKYIVKKTDGSVNTVTIDPNGAETIDGAATFVLTVQYQAIEFQSDGAQWWIV